MGKRTKKLIAREFLYLLGTIIIYFIIIIVWNTLNESNQNKIELIQNDISKITNREKLPFRIKVFDYLNSELEIDKRDKFYKSKIFIKNLKTDNEMVKELYSYLKEKKTINISELEFKNKIENDNKSEIYLIKISLLEKKLEEIKSSSLNNKLDNNDLIKIFFILFLIFFVIRYVVYATKWSIIQLKD